MALARAQTLTSKARSTVIYAQCDPMCGNSLFTSSAFSTYFAPFHKIRRVMFELYWQSLLLLLCASLSIYLLLALHVVISKQFIFLFYFLTKINKQFIGYVRRTYGDARTHKCMYGAWSYSVLFF